MPLRATWPHRGRPRPKRTGGGTGNASILQGLRPSSSAQVPRLAHPDATSRPPESTRAAGVPRAATPPRSPSALSQRTVALPPDWLPQSSAGPPRASPGDAPPRPQSPTRAAGVPRVVTPPCSPSARGRLAVRPPSEPVLPSSPPTLPPGPQEPPAARQARRRAEVGCSSSRDVARKGGPPGPSRAVAAEVALPVQVPRAPGVPRVLAPPTVPVAPTPTSIRPAALEGAPVPRPALGRAQGEVRSPVPDRLPGRIPRRSPPRSGNVLPRRVGAPARTRPPRRATPMPPSRRSSAGALGPTCEANAGGPLGPPGSARPPRRPAGGRGSGTGWRTPRPSSGAAGPRTGEATSDSRKGGWRRGGPRGRPGAPGCPAERRTDRTAAHTRRTVRTARPSSAPPTEGKGVATRTVHLEVRI